MQKKNNQMFIDAGYKEAWALEKGLDQFAIDNGLVIVKIVTLDDILFVKGERASNIVIRDKSDLGEGYEADFVAIKILTKNFHLFIKNECDMGFVNYFTARNLEYRKACSAINAEIRGTRGEYVGAIAPFGYYRYRKKLYVDEYEAFIVKFMYYRRMQGLSYRKISDELRLRGWVNRRKKPFSACSVKGIIENRRFYQGYTNYKGVEYKGKHPAILKDNDALLDEQWIDKHFDVETERRIMEHKLRVSNDMRVPKEVSPFIVADSSDFKQAKIKVHRK